MIITGHPGSTLISCVREPSEFVFQRGLRLNYKYYITKQICPALNRVFNIIGVDTLEWYRSMPKIDRTLYGFGLRGQQNRNGNGQGKLCLPLYHVDTYQKSFRDAKLAHHFSVLPRHRMRRVPEYDHSRYLLCRMLCRSSSQRAGPAESHSMLGTPTGLSVPAMQYLHDVASNGWWMSAGGMHVDGLSNHLQANRT